jgi:hypothetical protein
MREMKDPRMKMREAQEKHKKMREMKDPRMKI